MHLNFHSSQKKISWRKLIIKLYWLPPLGQKTQTFWNDMNCKGWQQLYISSMSICIISHNIALIISYKWFWIFVVRRERGYQSDWPMAAWHMIWSMNTVYWWADAEWCTCHERERGQMLSVRDLNESHFLFKVSDPTEGQGQPPAPQQCVQRRLQLW